MTQHIQLQEVFLHGVIFKMGGDLIGIGVVRRVLDGTEIPDLILLGDDHQTAGVLAGSTAHAHTTCGKTVNFRRGRRLSPLGQVFFYIAVSGFFCHRTHGACPENMGFSEHFRTVGMGICLIFAGEIQVNIRHFIAAESKKGFKGNIKAFLCIGRTTFGADRIRQVCAALKALGHIKGSVFTLRVGTAVMGREGVNLCNARHKRYNGRANRTTGAHQITILQRVLYQTLGRHIDHIIVTGDDVVQLRFDTAADQLRGIFTVKAVHFAVYQRLQIFHGVFDLRGKEVMRHRTHLIAHIGDTVGVRDHHLVCLFFTKIREFPKHFIGGAQIQGVGSVAILKALGRQQNVTENLILGI